MRRLMLLIFLSAMADGKHDTDDSPLEKVLKLNGRNFHRALREHKQLLVHFCKRRRETHSLVGGGQNRRAGDVLISHCVQILL